MKFLALLLALAAGDTYAAKVLEYRFDDPVATQAVDSSGNQLHGTLVGDIRIVPSTRGNAIAMDGDGDFFYLTDQPVLDLNAHTIMAWVYWRPNPNDIRIEVMEKAAAYWSNIRTPSGKLRAGGFFGPDCVSNARYQFHDTGAVIPKQQWTHVASTFDPATRASKVFFNGRLVKTASMTGSTCKSAEPLAVGSSLVTERTFRNDAFFNGMMDDVRLFDSALSAAAVRSQMSAR